MLPVLFDIQVAQQQTDRTVIGWLHAPGPGTQDPALKVEVMRSYAPDGSFKTIGSVHPSARVFVDTEANVRNRWLSAYYRLKVSDSTDSEEYGTFYVLDGQDRIARMISRRMDLMLKNIDASPVLIYQQVFNEERCSDCWDPVTQQVMYGNCATCGGTGFKGPVMGYYNPVLTLMDIRPAEVAQNIEDVASSINQATGRLGAFPVLRPGDLVTQVNRAIIWRVASVTPQRKDHALITQDPVSLVGVKPGDIEFRLDIPDTLTPVLTRRRVEKEKILQDNPGGSPKFLEVLV